MTGMLLAGIVSTTFSFGEVRLNCPEDNGWKICLFTTMRKQESLKTPAKCNLA